MRSDSLFFYNLTLAMQNFKRAPTLYLLIMLTLSIGVGVLCANLALVSSMASDPIPGKSDNLIHISMNTWPDDQPPDEPMHILRYRDAIKIAESTMKLKNILGKQTIKEFIMENKDNKELYENYLFLISQVEKLSLIKNDNQFLIKKSLNFTNKLLSSINNNTSGCNVYTRKSNY